jgi:hypothetical protein
MAIGRSRRPRGPTYARGANRSQFEDPELAVNARHLATRRAHPAFKFFTSLIPEAESFNLESFVPATTGGLEEHMLPPQMSGWGGLTPLGWRAATYLSEPHFHFLFLFTFSSSLLSDRWPYGNVGSLFLFSNLPESHLLLFNPIFLPVLFLTCELRQLTSG